MRKVKVITDSTVNLPEKYKKELFIDEIPLHVIWGEEIFRDNIDITPDEFYDRLGKEKSMPTTSQPSPQEFVNLFQKYLDLGYDILSIHISSKLSGTVDSSNKAKELLGGRNIEILDSKFTSMGTGFQVIESAKKASDGFSLEDCKKAAEKIREKTSIYFVVSTLEYLKRGGRIGGAAAFLGSALDLKPILYVHEGKIEPFEKIRTIRKALLRLVDILQEKVGDHRPLYLGIAQATAPESSELIKKEIYYRFSNDDILELIETSLSPVIGVHAGPGAVALCFAYTD